MNQNENYLKERIENGEYYKDGLDWFYNKYIGTYKGVVNLIGMILLLGFIIVFFIFASFSAVKSIKTNNGVADLESEFEDEFLMERIKKHYNNNEKNILRFKIETYVNYFETYNFNRFNIYEINDKVRIIKANSSRNVGEMFERMVQSNYIPEIFSGVTRASKIISFEFMENEENALDRIKRKIMPEKVINKVRVGVISTAYKDEGKNVVKEERRNIEITFKHNPLRRNAEGKFEDMQFIITSYNYI